MDDRASLADGERIVTAYAERMEGSGWSNAPVWVIVRRRDGTLREACLQPCEQSADMALLYAVSEAAHKAMTMCAQVIVRRATVSEKATVRRAKRG